MDGMYAGFAGAKAGHLILGLKKVTAKTLAVLMGWILARHLFQGPVPFGTGLFYAQRILKWAHSMFE